LFPGSKGCETIGASCPSTEWAEGLPATGVLYVRAGGGTGGSGTQADPYRTIGAALAAASGTTTIALGKGEYDESVVIRGNVSLIGACAAETTLGSSLPALGYGVVEVNSGTVRIANVTVRAARRQGIRFEGALEGTVEGVLIEGTAVVGLSVFAGARVTARNVAIRNTAAHDDGTAGRGIGLEDRGVLTLERAVVEGNRSEGIAVLGSGCELRASDVRVSGTERSADDFGDGLTASGAVVVEADGLVLEDNAILGALVLLGGPSISLTNAVIRDNGAPGIQIGPEATGTLRRVRIEGNAEAGLQVQEAMVTAEDLVTRGNGERGIVVQNGALLNVTRALVTDNGATGIIVLGTMTPSRLELHDAVVRHNEGRSIQIQEGGDATLARVETSEALGTEIVIRGEGVLVNASDLFIHDPRREEGVAPDQDRARGIEARVGAEVILDRVRIERAHQLGIFVESATATIRDVVVRGTTAREDFIGDFGRGIEIQASMATIERAVLMENGGAGLAAGSGSRVTASDLLVTDTRGTGTLRASGKGVIANGGTTLELLRVRLERNREVSLAAFEAGTRITGSEVAVIDSLVRDCVTDVCPEYGAGIGAGAYLGAFVHLDNFLIDRSALVGVQMEGPSMELRTGTISHALIGINVLGAEVDFETVLQDVALIENTRNIDAMSLPVPDTTLPPIDEP
jgi:hypothetical protein